jgi:hypothetical protein
MNGRMPRVVFCFIWLVILAAQAGCQNQGSYKLHIEFPDEEAKTSISLVHVLVLKPLLHTCEELILGGIDPKSLTALSEIELSYTPDAPVASRRNPGTEVR